MGGWWVVMSGPRLEHVRWEWSTVRRGLIAASPWRYPCYPVCRPASGYVRVRGGGSSVFVRFGWITTSTVVGGVLPVWPGVGVGPAGVARSPETSGRARQRRLGTALSGRAKATMVDRQDSLTVMAKRTAKRDVNNGRVQAEPGRLDVPPPSPLWLPSVVKGSSLNALDRWQIRASGRGKIRASEGRRGAGDLRMPEF
jgi:hypothetical protein